MSSNGYYRELVQRRLAVHHAGMEMRLARAREQEPLVLAVAHKLSQTGWAHQMTMTPNMSVVFVMDTGRVALKHQYQAVKQALAECHDVHFDVADGRPRLHVSSRNDPGLSCTVVFGEDDEQHPFDD